MRIETLRQRLRELGAKPQHEQRVLQAWTRLRSLDTRHRRAEDFLPLRLREALPGLTEELAGLARVRSEHPGADGSARLLVRLAAWQGLVEATAEGPRLTDAGLERARRLVLAHRLWERFLIERVDIAPDHVDRDADALEHLLDRETVAELQQRLAGGETPQSPHKILPSEGEAK